MQTKTVTLTGLDGEEFEYTMRKLSWRETMAHPTLRRMFGMGESKAALAKQMDAEVEESDLPVEDGGTGGEEREAVAAEPDAGIDTEELLIELITACSVEPAYTRETIDDEDPGKVWVMFLELQKYTGLANVGAFTAQFRQ